MIGSLYGSANLHRDMVKLIDLYMRKRLKIDELISRTIKLEDVNAAFDAMEKGEVARSVIAFVAIGGRQHRPPCRLAARTARPRRASGALRGSPAGTAAGAANRREMCRQPLLTWRAVPRRVERSRLATTGDLERPTRNTERLCNLAASRS